MAHPEYVNGCARCDRCVAPIDDPDGIRCPLDDVGFETAS